MELEEAIRVYNELRNNKDVERYCEALHIVCQEWDKAKPELEFYKSSNKYDYYIELPYKQLTVFGDGKTGYRNNGFNYIGKGINGNKSSLNGCVGLCNNSKEEVMKSIDRSIEEDNKKDGDRYETQYEKDI